MYVSISDCSWNIHMYVQVVYLYVSLNVITKWLWGLIFIMQYLVNALVSNNYRLLGGKLVGGGTSACGCIYIDVSVYI